MSATTYFMYVLVETQLHLFEMDLEYDPWKLDDAQTNEWLNSVFRQLGYEVTPKLRSQAEVYVFKSNEERIAAALDDPAVLLQAGAMPTAGEG